MTATIHQFPTSAIQTRNTLRKAIQRNDMDSYISYVIDCGWYRIQMQVLPMEYFKALTEGMVRAQQQLIRSAE